MRALVHAARQFMTNVPETVDDRWIGNLTVGRQSAQWGPCRMASGRDNQSAQRRLEASFGMGQSQVDFDLGFYESLLSRSPGFLDVLWAKSDLCLLLGQHERAVILSRRIVDLAPRSASAWYHLACSLSMTGQVTEAVATLAAAFERGYDNIYRLEAEPQLANLKEHPDYQRLLRRLALGTFEGDAAA